MSESTTTSRAIAMPGKPSADKQTKRKEQDTSKDNIENNSENGKKRKKQDVDSKNDPAPEIQQKQKKLKQSEQRTSKPDEKKLFPVLIRGLGEVSIADIEDLFSACGQFKNARITGHGKALINFLERPSAAAAHKLDGTEFEGRTIRVSILKPAADRDTKTAEDEEDGDDVKFTVVVNNVPPGTNEDELHVASLKHGPVTSVRLDAKKPDIAWVEFEDKRGARSAARKGIRLGRSLCKAVRVMPKAFRASGGDDDGEEGGKDAKGKNSTTALIRGLAPEVIADDIRTLLEGCGAIRDVRIANPSSGRIAFVDFETKTALHKARRLKAMLAGKPLSLRPAKNVAAPAGGGDGGAAAEHGPKPAFCRTIIVKNLAYDLADSEEKIQQKVKRIFKVCGTVTAVRPFMDRPHAAGGGADSDAPPKFKGMAYVQFGETEAVDQALRMNGRDNEGRPMKIDWSDNLEAALKKKKAAKRLKSADGGGGKHKGGGGSSGKYSGGGGGAGKHGGMGRNKAAGGGGKDGRQRGERKQGESR